MTMMRVPGRKLARKILRPVSRALFPGALIIGYHRIVNTEWDPLGLAVSPGNFESQLDMLTKLRELVTVGELALRRAAGEPLERYAALTFDDGYDDFAATVVPIIEARGIPATVFVTTGFVERSFWWDEVTSLLTPTGRSAPALEVHRTGAKKSWHFRQLDHAEGRAAAARAICDAMACGEKSEVRAVLKQIREWSGVSGTAGPNYGPMSREQLEALARHPLVELGAHTVAHGCLALLEPEAQHDEISQSKAALETLRETAVTVFSYPNGSFSRTTRDLVEALGFCCACTSIEGAFHRRADPFRMPRIWAPDAAGPTFRLWLGNWLTETR